MDNAIPSFRISSPGNFTGRAIISGGQTGADRAALDAAMSKGWPIGGWCPRGRRSEDGAIPSDYPLEESASRNYAVRTRWNVRDSDGTLLLTSGPVTGGTSLTGAIARELERPLCVVDFEKKADVSTVVEWMQSNRIRILNVAGPRASTSPEIYDQAFDFIVELIDALSSKNNAVDS